MRIVSLVENTPTGGLSGAHGLSLYVETARHRLLFDVGPDDTLFTNASQLHVDLSLVDTVIISHGHYDHGGALRSFLQLNPRAQVYVQRQAFEHHESRTQPPYRDIGLEPELMSHPQVRLLDGDWQIDEELSLFTVPDATLCLSEANSNLYENGQPDPFFHEQNLLIRDGACVLLMGCGHSGVVNILQKAQPLAPTVCIGGFHLYSPSRGETVSQTLLEEIAGHLRDYPSLQFYTCHCTGEEALRFLARHVPTLHPFHCGESLTL